MIFRKMNYYYWENKQLESNKKEEIIEFTLFMLDLMVDIFKGNFQYAL